MPHNRPSGTQQRAAQAWPPQVDGIRAGRHPGISDADGVAITPPASGLEQRK